MGKFRWATCFTVGRPRRVRLDLYTEQLFTAGAGDGMLPGLFGQAHHGLTMGAIPEGVGLAILPTAFFQPPPTAQLSLEPQKPTVFLLAGGHVAAEHTKQLVADQNKDRQIQPPGTDEQADHQQHQVDDHNKGTESIVGAVAAGHKAGQCVAKFSHGIFPFPKLCASIPQSCYGFLTKSTAFF